jgi:hypothetical protein
VKTKLSGMYSDGKNPNLFMPSAESFAKSAIGTIGNASETCGSMGHQIQVNLWVNYLVKFSNILV